MPYISKEDRQIYAKEITALTQKLGSLSEADLAGHLNYCFSKIAFTLLDNKRRYVRANTINGVFVSAQQEFYRRKVLPYENEKIEENGDI